MLWQWLNCCLEFIIHPSNQIYIVLLQQDHSMAIVHRMEIIAIPVTCLQSRIWGTFYLRHSIHIHLTNIPSLTLFTWNWYYMSYHVRLMTVKLCWSSYILLVFVICNLQNNIIEIGTLSKLNYFKMVDSWKYEEIWEWLQLSWSPLHGTVGYCNWCLHGGRLRSALHIEHGAIWLSSWFYLPLILIDSNIVAY